MLTEILSRLPEDFPWRGSIRWYDVIDSTNNRAKAMADEGAPSGTVLIADCQTGGRGRRGRSFRSPAGMGIYMSVILRPECAAGELMHLTCAVSEVMCDAVEKAASIRPGVKWTNDLVYNRRKLAGILTELSLRPGTDRVDWAVIGIGINCCQQPADFPDEIRSFAGSVAMAAGKSVDRAALAAAMVEALHRLDRDLLARKDALMADYRRDCITIGSPICLLRSGQVRHGLALDVDADGALIVQFDTGETEAVSSGEVSVRGMYGYV